jgi:membrane-bound lytic murein transglycosylase B
VAKTVAEPEVPAAPVRRRPAVRLFGRLCLVLLAMAVAAGTIWLVRTATGPDAGSADVSYPPVTAADVQPGSALPAGVDGAAAPQAGTAGADPLEAWAARTAGRTTIPARALSAYGNAELVLRATDPGCHVTWATLAGIARIESNHGRFGGASLGADGRPSKPIIGVPLDGSAGVRAIGDTDGGAIDGDSSLDRAVGPLQFIPSTWRKWASDANRDGRAEPQQIDDAALSAARYLCAGSRNLATPAGWWSAVLSYNNSTTYAQKVFGQADAYARAAA